MKKHVVKMIGDEKGKVMILALILLVVGGLIMGPLLGLMSTGLSAGQTYERKTAGLYAADAGLEDAINWLINGKPVDWPWTWDGQAEAGNRTTPILINGHEVYVTVETLESENTYMVSSVAEGPEGTTTVMSTLWAIHIIKGCAEYSGPKTVLYGNVYVTEDVTVEVGAKIDGNLVVGGDLTLQQQGGIDGDVSVTGNITMENSSSVTGNLCTDGDLVMGNSASITGDVLVGGDVILGNSASITGDLFVFGDLFISNKAKITGNVYTWRNITFYHDANAKIDGAVYADGDITILLAHPQSTITGTVYATDSILFDPTGKGPIPQYEEYYDVQFPDPPPCPGIPATPTKIKTYEVG